MNKFIVMGRLVNTPEIKTTQSGVLTCSFRIAVDRNFQKKGEEKQTDFFNVTAWRGTAEFIAKYFTRGRMILIDGEMQTRQYTDKNGNNATRYEIMANNVYFAGDKPAAPAPQMMSAPAPVNPAGIPADAIVNADGTINYNDDYPF